jgi:hypothetical protein
LGGFIALAFATDGFTAEAAEGVDHGGEDAEVGEGIGLILQAGQEVEEAGGGNAQGGFLEGSGVVGEEVGSEIEVGDLVFEVLLVGEPLLVRAASPLGEVLLALRAEDGDLCPARHGTNRTDKMDMFIVAQRWASSGSCSR